MIQLARASAELSELGRGLMVAMRFSLIAALALIVLSGCNQSTEAIVVTPPPPPVKKRVVYKAPVQKRPITPRVASIDNRISRNPNSTNIRLSNVTIHNQAKKIFAESGADNQTRVANVMSFLNHQKVRWIDVNLTNQTLSRYQNGKKISTVEISGAVGQTFSEFEEPEGSKTPHNHVGVFSILEIEPVRFSSTYQVDMVQWQKYFKGHGIHDCQPQDRKYLGTPASHGCIRVAPEDNPYGWTRVGDIVFCHQ